MGGLVLKMAPHERVLINGAVVENGDRRGRIRILTPNAQILRMKDALHPDAVDTPIKRVCYVVQLALSGDLDEELAKRETLVSIDKLNKVFVDADSLATLSDAKMKLDENKFYLCLKELQKLLLAEARMLKV